MEDLICGPCAQKYGVSQEVRVETALARSVGVEYYCPGCKQTHKLNSPSKHDTSFMEGQYVLTGIR